jgi:CheY-like chemotaxis protein
MSNLLLITDVARLQNIFGRLVEDTGIRLRIVNNLEKGGEEIAIEKPDVVFVQTHLSGLSADILLKHLKKQLGRKRSRFVLLASPAQASDSILKTYQGWLDTSAEDGQLFSELLRLLESLLSKPKKNEERPVPLHVPEAPPISGPVSSEESSALLGRLSSPGKEDPKQAETDVQFPVVPAANEPSLEEQGVTYAPRQRLTVYSEFNSSFDSAVSSTPEPERLEQASALSHDWHDEEIDTVETRPAQSKKRSFLLWLVPVVIVVVVITLLQQQKSSLTQEASPAKVAVPAMMKTAVQAPLSTPVVAPAMPEPVRPSEAGPSPSAIPVPGGNTIVPKATNENPGPKSPASASLRLKALPGFIPLQGVDKQFSVTHPGWERYDANGTEFKVFRESQAIKAIQVIDRSGAGMRETFMKDLVRQVARDPAIKIETSEKKGGYEIQRGSVADAIQAVYYRDENGGLLRAFVLTWQ